VFVARRRTVQAVGRPVKRLYAPPGPELEQALSLPTEVKEADFDLSHYTVLVYGREKIGKSTLASDFPEALFFTTEPGTKGLRIYEFNPEHGGVSSWNVLRQGVDLLEKSKKFKTVVFDTVDRAYDMCLDFVCKERHIEYPGQDSAGSEDYGKSWRAVKQEFMEQVHRILRTGRGLLFLSHVKEQEIKTRTGDKYDRIFPSMSNQARNVIEALVDMFFYAEYAKDKKGNTIRILITEGDDVVWAGHRPSFGKMPRFLPLLEKGGYKVIEQAFLGKYPGLDISTFMPARQTLGPSKSLIQREQGKAALHAAGKE